MEIVRQLVREEMYTFTPNDGTEEVNIMSGRLREWLHANAMDKIVELTFPADETLESMVERHGLEQPRIDSMTVFEANEPVIVGLWPNGTHILIDGGHRRHFWAKQGVYVLKGWAVPIEIWSSFIFKPEDVPGLIAHHPNGSLLPQRSKK